jgi:hypothetical protein
LTVARSWRVARSTMRNRVRWVRDDTVRLSG